VSHDRLARVSTNGHKDSLVRQVSPAESYWPHRVGREVITDVWPRLDYQERGLRQLIGRICKGEIARLILSHTDRLLVSDPNLSSAFASTLSLRWRSSTCGGGGELWGRASEVWSDS